ncbi:unnamed protein product [Haemonchus placei]|uniref:Uncharacterized protein n=1 Tax=Haemonchus placei TaxID=6290 RepID=A0A3P7SJ21_HAEPC|nr:unnamed protein product [Haemonchus placei]
MRGSISSKSANLHAFFATNELLPTHTSALAFGSTPYDSSKPQKDFYNNNTLVNLSKLFCAAVLLTAFVLVMTRGFSYFSPNETNSTSTSLFFL